ncbi:MAG: hypothetical protein WAV41_01205 [Microgenomates group bacterium]
MKNIVVDKPSEISQIAYFLNHSDIFSSVNISSISANQNYLKWSAPSTDYPCIYNSYYLFSPFKIVLYPHPFVVPTDESGESKIILDQVKTKLMEAILRII